MAKTTSNFLWKFGQLCGTQIVTLLVSIIFVRVLSPNDFGRVALVAVFINILQVFVDSGLGSALIQKKDADDLDFSSVFYFNFFVCILLYALMFFSAPLIARFYKDDSLTSIVRVISLLIVLSGIKGIQQAYVSRKMIFRKFFFATLGGTVFSAILGIYLAYSGYGVWALVIQQLSHNFIDTLILWLTVKWRPKLIFSWIRLKGLLSYGWKLLASSLLDSVYGNLSNLIIGKKYSPSDLAFYKQGNDIPFISTYVSSSVNSVFFPEMANAQDDRERVKELTRQSILLSTYFMAPILMVILFSAEPIVRLILTEKWIPCVPYLRIFCIVYLIHPFSAVNLTVIKAVGRSDLALKLEIVKKVVGLVALCGAMWFGVKAIACFVLFNMIFCQIIDSLVSYKFTKYSGFEQVKDALPGIILAVFSGFVASLIGLLSLSDIYTLILEILLALSLYIGLSMLFHLRAYEYFKAELRLLISNKNVDSML